MLKSWLPVSLALAASMAAATLRDPTRPGGGAPVPHAAAASKLHLTLVRLGAEPLAVINGRNVKPGQAIAGYRLISLHPASATLAGADGHLVLRLAPTIRKSPPPPSSQNRRP